MWKMAPDGLKGVPQGSITSIAPGDVVSINDYYNGALQPSGHVLIVSAVNGSAVTYVSQNAGSNTTATVTTTGNLSGGDLTVKRSGDWTYKVLGIVHAPTGGVPNWTAAKAPTPPNANSTNPEAYLNLVACPSATSCVAFGGYDDSSGNADGLLLTGAGTSWNAAEAPLPANAGTQLDSGVTFESVACPSSTVCVAAGMYVDSSGNNDGLFLTTGSIGWHRRLGRLPRGARSSQK